MGQQLDQLTRELKFVGETVAMHARYHLTVTPALPDAAQSAACRIGAARFDEFVTQVARRVDQEKPLIRETLDRLAATNAHRLSPEDQAPQSAAGEHVDHADRAPTNGRSLDAHVAGSRWQDRVPCATCVRRAKRSRCGARSQPLPSPKMSGAISPNVGDG
jgi:hypothetical protein